LLIERFRDQVGDAAGTRISKTCFGSRIARGGDAGARSRNAALPDHRRRNLRLIMAGGSKSGSASGAGHYFEVRRDGSRGTLNKAWARTHGCSARRSARTPSILDRERLPPDLVIIMIIITQGFS
jgi:hypothetical protein